MLLSNLTVKRNGFKKVKFNFVTVEGLLFFADEARNIKILYLTKNE